MIIIDSTAEIETASWYDLWQAAVVVHGMLCETRERWAGEISW